MGALVVFQHVNARGSVPAIVSLEHAIPRPGVCVYVCV